MQLSLALNEVDCRAKNEIDEHFIKCVIILNIFYYWPYGSWCQFLKTFYVCNLRMFVKSYSVCSRKEFQLSIIFTRLEPAWVTQLSCASLAFLTNIRLSWKGLTWKNTLAYYKHSWIMGVISFTTSVPMSLNPGTVRAGLPYAL